MSLRLFPNRDDGRLAVSFFDADAADICEAYCTWMADVVGYDCRIDGLPCCEETWQSFLGDYVGDPDTGILMPTKSSWCAFVENGRGIPRSTLFSLSKRMSIRAIAFLVSVKEDAPIDHTYGVAFEYYDGRSGVVEERSVGAYYDGTWQFSARGAVLDFERPHLYSLPEIADRLTPKVLSEYASALGIMLDGAYEFYDYKRAIGLKWTLKERFARMSREEQTADLLRLLEPELGDS